MQSNYLIPQASYNVSKLFRIESLLQTLCRALPIYRGLSSSINSRVKSIARQLGRGMSVFSKILWQERMSRVRFTVISHTPMRSRFYQTHIMYKRYRDGSCLINLIYFALHVFQIRNLLHCVDESWLNMSFKVTRLGEGVADDAVAMLLPLWMHTVILWRHAVWIRIVTSHKSWMGYEYSLPNLNRPRAIHKHNPRPLETVGRVW